MISIGTNSLDTSILQELGEINIIYYYLGICKIPCVIRSPYRADNHPSLGIFSKDGITIGWVDFALKEGGGLIDLLSKCWGESHLFVLKRIREDSSNITKASLIPVSKLNSYTKNNYISKKEKVDIQCKVREWRDYDLEYWGSYGISKEWLEYADVYPISHKIIIKGDKRYVFVADKYAYAYLEFKEGKQTMKIYQPYNTKGFKWSTSTDRSVISLWTKVPEYGDKICICSSLKDSLCLWINTGIPAISPQGEGYPISNTAVSELKRRYKEIYIALDGDQAGIDDSIKLQKETAFKIINCPLIDKAKDWSDIYHYYGKDVLLKEFKKAFESAH